MIDSSVVRAHRHAAGAVGGQEAQGFGRSKGGFTSKIHVKVDSFGLLLKVSLTAGQKSDIGEAKNLIGEEICSYLLADKGYDANHLRNYLIARKIKPVIPGRTNRVQPIEYDAHIYKERNYVERFFGRIKEFRRIATRFDKTATMYLASITLVAIFIQLSL
jgi:transposase